MSSLKSFCSGLIERRNHLWSGSLRRLGIKSRLSIAHSLFLFRKTLPSKPPNLDHFLDVIESPCPEPDEEFVDFCRTETRKIFSSGWDLKKYPSACISSTVSTSSCAENGKANGGCRKWVLDSKMPNVSCRDDFVESLLTYNKYSRSTPSRLVAVETGGKWRKITVPSGNLSLLRPLHTAIYARLSEQSWLLRGKETANKFSDFVTVVGEEFVSGDYESATDFLNTRVSKEVLAQILMRCRAVPHGVSQMAMDSLSLPVSLRREDGTNRVAQQNSGQMMGYLLSFPLLCLINYLTFRFVIRRDVPVKINGDDIVFRSTPEEKEAWMAQVGKSGLRLSVGKTMVNKKFFTLNSCLFEARKETVKALPFIRSTALFPKDKDPSSVMGLAGRYQSFCPGYSGVKRRHLRVAWLRFNRNLIDVTRRSVSRGLGLNVDYCMLVESGLWAREAWYLSLEKESPLPAPFSEWACPPVGFKYIRVPRVTDEIRLAGEGVSSAFVEAAWNRPEDKPTNEWFAEMREGTYDHGFWFESRSNGALRRAKLLKLSVRNAGRFLRPDRSLFDSRAHRLIRYGVWVKEDFEPRFSFESSVSQFDIDLPRRIRSSVGATADTNDSSILDIDVRDYFEPQFECGELFFGHEKSVTSSRDVSMTANDFPILLRSRCPTASAVRVFSRGGVGFAPPPCLL